MSQSAPVLLPSETFLWCRQIPNRGQTPNAPFPGPFRSSASHHSPFVCEGSSVKAGDATRRAVLSIGVTPCVSGEFSTSARPEVVNRLWADVSSAATVKKLLQIKFTQLPAASVRNIMGWCSDFTTSKRNASKLDLSFLSPPFFSQWGTIERDSTVDSAAYPWVIKGFLSLKPGVSLVWLCMVHLLQVILPS